MKQIQPIQVWHNGGLVTATALYITFKTDDLSSTAQFGYTLLDEINGMPLINGTLVMDGDDYNNFTSNEYAWTWAAAKLNLTLVSE